MTHVAHACWHLASKAKAGARTDAISDAPMLLQLWKPPSRARPPSWCAEKRLTTRATTMLSPAAAWRARHAMLHLATFGGCPVRHLAQKETARKITQTSRSLTKLRVSNGFSSSSGDGAAPALGLHGSPNMGSLLSRDGA